MRRVFPPFQFGLHQRKPTGEALRLRRGGEFPQLPIKRFTLVYKNSVNGLKTAGNKQTYLRTVNLKFVSEGKACLNHHRVKWDMDSSPECAVTMKGTGHLYWTFYILELFPGGHRRSFVSHQGLISSSGTMLGARVPSEASLPDILIGPRRAVSEWWTHVRSSVNDEFMWKLMASYTSRCIREGPVNERTPFSLALPYELWPLSPSDGWALLSISTPVLQKMPK